MRSRTKVRSGTQMGANAAGMTQAGMTTQTGPSGRAKVRASGSSGGMAGATGGMGGSAAASDSGTGGPSR